MKKAIIYAVAMFVSASAFATALTAARNTPERSGEYVSLTVKSNETIYAGSGVSVDSSGYAVSASDATGDKFVGRAEESKANTSSDYSATMTIKVRRGTFAWANGANYTDANIGDYAYVFDDATMNAAASNTYDIIAGVIVDVDSVNGVWVDSYAVGGQGAASFTTLGASGAVALSSTLAVTGVGTFTAESVHNGGIDADGITVDASDGIDTKTAGILLVGDTVATSVEIADTLVNTAVKGTLSVDEDTTLTGTTLLTGVATLTAEPVLTEAAIGDVSTGETVVFTNAPSGSETDPIWFEVSWTNGSTYYVPGVLKP